MRDAWTHTVPCHDLAGRDRYAQVVITDDNMVALVAPPGGSAVWHPGDLNRLKELITAAQLEAISRRGGSR